MIEEDFNLSEKIGYFDDKQIDKKLLVEDVKEFIRRLKEEVGAIHGASCPIIKEIDKLAGEKLVDSPQTKPDRVKSDNGQEKTTNSRDNKIESATSFSRDKTADSRKGKVGK